jgi:hypothetical protein
MKACTLVFSPFFSPSTTWPLRCSWRFSLQINLVSDLDAWSDLLDIPKKVFNSLPLYRVQKLKRYSLNVKLWKEYLINHLASPSYYLISFLVFMSFLWVVFMSCFYISLSSWLHELIVFIFHCPHDWSYDFYELIIFTLMSLWYILNPLSSYLVVLVI